MAEREGMMKYYLITYWLPKQSRQFSQPQSVVAKSFREYNEIIRKIDQLGYEIEHVKEFDPVPTDERFYA